jgi:hypothetical protein
MTEANESTGDRPDDVDPENDQPEKKDRIKVRLTLFFDGTENNKTNTDSRYANNAAFEKYGEEGSSYYNDYSNVARLERFLEKGASGYDYHVKLYTEGIGTVNDYADSGWGNIAGKGDTGVKAKTDKGLLKAISQLEKTLPQSVVIEKLTVDTCGFSRGASAARYCVHRLLHTIEQAPPRPKLLALKSRLTGLGFKVEKVEVKAVFLYDTVSALGIA